MKPILFLLCLFALLTLALPCIADQPQTVDWTPAASTSSTPAVLMVSCAGGQCAAARPVARVGRIATAPVRAVLQARPLRRVITRAQPLRRMVGVVGSVRPLRFFRGLICR